MVTINREEEMFFLIGCFFGAMLWGLIQGAHSMDTRSADIPRLCLSNCLCGKYTAECILSFCEQEYETTSTVLILRGGMCHSQWHRLKDLPARTKVELHNARCPQVLDHCE